MALNKDLSSKQIAISLSVIVVIILAVGAYYVIGNSSPADIFNSDQSTESDQSNDKPDDSSSDNNQSQKSANQLVDKAKQSEKDGDKNQAVKDYQAAADSYKSTGDDASAAMMQKMADNINKAPDSDVSKYELLPQ